MSGFTWPAVEDALTAWARNATALAVIKAEQEGPRPVAPHVVMTILGLAGSGMDWVDVEDADDPEPGADVEHVARGHRRLTARFECFAGGGTTALPSRGATSTKAKLERMIGSASLPSQEAAFEAAGLGLLSIGEVTPIPGVLGASFEPRSMVEVAFGLFSEVAELGTWIQATEVQQIDADGDDVGDPVVVGDVQVLGAPDDLEADPGNASVALTWDAVPGADSYRVYRAEAPGVTTGSTLAGSPTAASFNDTGRTNGTAYFYAVLAVSTVVAPSALSDEVTATPSA